MRYLFVLLLLMFSIPSHAVPLEGLYSASVVVADQSQAVRNAAMRKVLKKVVQKVSGRPRELENPALQAALSNVGSYVEQFQYKTLDKEVTAYRLTIHFQKSALDKVLQQFSVPIWGKNRPEVLLWLAVDNGAKRHILADEKTVEMVLAAAVDAGLAVTLPLLDLDDQRALSFNDVWAGFSDQVLNASQRYSVKNVVHGRLLKVSNGSWRLSGTLLNGSQQYPMLLQKGSMNNVLTGFLAETAEHLADVYAPRGVTQQQQLVLHVNGVKNLAKLAEVTGYLSSLDKVKAVTWGALQGANLKLLLTISGDVSVLQDVIGLNTVLSQVEPPSFYSESVRGADTGVIDFSLQQTAVENVMSAPVMEALHYRAN